MFTVKNKNKGSRNLNKEIYNNVQYCARDIGNVQTTVLFAQVYVK